MEFSVAEKASLSFLGLLPWMDRADAADTLPGHNKCPDCCLVIGCETCGPCEEHDDE